MKNRIVLSILGISMLSSIGFSVAAQQMSAPKEDRRTFWEKHTQKIRVAFGVLVSIGIIIGLATLGNKTKDAVDAANLLGDDYVNALAIVAVLGPLYMDNTISLLTTALNRNIIDLEFTTYIVVTIGKALANFWGVSYAEFVAKAGIAGLKSAAKEVRAEIKREINQQWDKFKAWLTAP